MYAFLAMCRSNIVHPKANIHTTIVPIVEIIDICHTNHKHIQLNRGHLSYHSH